MKPRNSTPFRSHGSITAAFSIALFSHFVTPCALAANRWWDGGTVNIVAAGNGAAAASADATGTWSTGISNWDQGNTLAHVAWVNAQNDTALFNGGTNTITLGSDVTVGGITQTGGGSGINITGVAGSFKITLGATGNNTFQVFSGTSARSATINAEITGVSGNNLNFTGGVLILNGVNTFQGNIALASSGAPGTLSIGAAGSLGSGNYAGNISIASGRNFNYNSSANQTLSGLISGLGNLNKATNTASTLTLSNNNTGFTGPATVSAGTLAITSSGAINASSGITLNGSSAKLLQTSSAAIIPAVTLTNGTVTGSGTVNTINVGAATGGVISNNDGVAGTPLTVGTLTFNGAATINTFGNASAAIVTTTLAANVAGLVTINPTAATWTTGSTYDLISYGGVTNLAQFTIGTVTGKSGRQTATIGNSGTAITVLIGGTTDFPYWVGTTNSQWDTTTNNNWKLFTATTDTNFIPTDDVLFNDNTSGAGPITVNIDVANVATSSTTFDNSTKNYVLNSSGSFGISAGSLTKNGSGNVTISTNNTYSGGSTINAGTLVLGNANAVSTGTLTLNGGNLDSSVANLVNAGNNAQAWNSNFTFVGTESLNLGTGAVTMSSDRTVTVTANSLTIGGAIGGGAASLTKAGAGTLILSQTSAYSGDTTITGGTLQLGDGIAANGAVASNIVNNTALVIANSATQTIANTISGSGTLTKTNATTLTLSGANSYNGTTTISAGTLSLGSVSALGSTSSLILGGASSSTLSSNTTGITIAAPITTANTGITSTIAFGRATAAAGSITLNGAIGGNGNVSFTTSGSSGGNVQSINLGAAGTYAGSTVLNPADVSNSMTLRNTSGAANALPQTTVLTFGTRGGEGTGRTALFDLGSQNQTLAGLSNTGAVPNDRNHFVSSSGAATLTINNATPFTFGGTTLEGGGSTTRAQIQGAISLVKNGAGAFTLGGTLAGGASASGNTFTGTTQILGGILVLGESTSIQNSALDTGGSLAGNASNGLQTSVTTLTIGGLTGDKNLASLFETASGGYSTVTALTLKPVTGASHNYSGVIANGAPGMTLTKSGSGTQTLSGANSYTGATAITAGTLALGANNSLPATDVSIGSATLDASTFDDTLGMLDAAGSAVINLGADANLVFADSSAVDWTLPTAGTLNITGTFVSGSSLRFGNTSSGLTPTQLAAITATGFTGFGLDANGFLTATGGGGPGPLDNFLISAISSPQTVGTPITGITLTARDASNATVTSFTGTVNFGGTGGFTGTSATFTAGVLSGVSVLPTNAGSGLTFTVTDIGSGKTGSATITTIQTQYAAWAGGAVFTADANGDGVNNGVAFLLGAANPTVNAIPLLPVTTQSGGNLIMTFKSLNLAKRGGAVLNVQYSRDLGITDLWTSHTAAVPETSDTINSVVFATSVFDVNLNNNTATIPASAASPGTKLFGRLSGVSAP